MHEYNAGSLVSSDIIDNQLSGWPYPALTGFPDSLEEKENADDIILEGYRVVQDVAPFIELVRHEHALATHQTEDWAQKIEMSLKRGIVSLATELCISVISHSLTHPEDIGMTAAMEHAQSNDGIRYQRDYLIFRDAKVVMDHIKDEFEKLI
ncbi:unnamed protein product [Owenia fusiformis]|uniref:Uncharacterized protein n=1 Tax=Owenia fusiformis TaxID=6347 RepID=A0A8J1T6P8_OWEFU|nr:unnamed protein product [Owenia fusiformis]